MQKRGEMEKMVKRVKVTLTIRMDLDDSLEKEAQALNMSKSRHVENILLARKLQNDSLVAEKKEAVGVV
jgi:hypothetical protein